MNFDLTEEQQLLKDSVTRLLADRYGRVRVLRWTVLWFAVFTFALVIFTGQARDPSASASRAPARRGSGSPP